MSTGHLSGARCGLLSRSRRALAWALLFFAAGQLALVAVMEQRHAELRYPAFGYKLTALRARLAEHPGRPLLLALGSSRTLTAVWPTVIDHSWPATSACPLVFNFGLVQADPIVELLCLRQCLAEGIRPRTLTIEIIPPFLDQTPAYVQERWHSAIGLLRWDDASLLRRYQCRRRQVLTSWVLDRATSWFTHRRNLLNRYAPDWLPPEHRPFEELERLDARGWFAFPNALPADRHREAVEETQRTYAPALAHFHVGQLPDQALRELLSLCAANDIQALLVLMPESTAFRSWYPPAACAELDAYLANLHRDYGVPIVDARTWVPDTEILDGHHLVAVGAKTFSERLAHEVLAPQWQEKGPMARSSRLPSLP